MHDFETLRIDSQADQATCWLARPQRKNALNPQMIAELTKFFSTDVREKQYRVVVLRGEDGFFCAGADLNWMKDSAAFPAEQNMADAEALFDVFSALNSAECFTLACVEGGAFGGGIGLIACCDMALATQDCRFSLSEVRLGLSPATISPFVSACIGDSHARQLMLSALPFNAEHALRIGLLHQICEQHELQQNLEASLAALGKCAPHALRETKRLLQQDDAGRLAKLRSRTSELIAGLRTGPEGQEGLAAFLGKRAPAWAGPAGDDA